MQDEGREISVAVRVRIIETRGSIRRVMRTEDAASPMQQSRLDGVEFIVTACPLMDRWSRREIEYTIKETHEDTM